MRRAIEEGVLLNYVTLIEVSHYLRRLQKEEFHRIMEAIQNLSTITLVGLNDEIAHFAIDLMPNYASKRLGGRDCVILATMKLHGASRILTPDHSFREAKKSASIRLHSSIVSKTTEPLNLASPRESCSF